MVTCKTENGEPETASDSETEKSGHAEKGKKNRKRIHWFCSAKSQAVTLCSSTASISDPTTLGDSYKKQPTIPIFQLASWMWADLCCPTPQRAAISSTPCHPPAPHRSPALVENRALLLVGNPSSPGSPPRSKLSGLKGSFSPGSGTGTKGDL